MVNAENYRNVITCFQLIKSRVTPEECIEFMNMCNVDKDIFIYLINHVILIGDEFQTVKEALTYDNNRKYRLIKRANFDYVKEFIKKLYANEMENKKLFNELFELEKDGYINIAEDFRDFLSNKSIIVNIEKRYQNEIDKIKDSNIYKFDLTIRDLINELNDITEEYDKYKDDCTEEEHNEMMERINIIKEEINRMNEILDCCLSALYKIFGKND